MAEHGNIKYKNIFYMLTFSPEELMYIDINDASFEICKSSLDILGYMMNKSFEILESNDYFRAYSRVYEDNAKPHGRLDMQESINNGNCGNTTLSFTYNQLNINNTLNKLVKSAIRYIINSSRISGELQEEIELTLLKNYRALENVSELEISTEDIRSARKLGVPNWCKPALNSSLIVLEMLLFSNEVNTTQLFDLDDKARLKYIFEKFVRRYLKSVENEYKFNVTHYTYKDKEGNIRIPDMVLHDESNSYLVIDAKWYSKTESYTTNQDTMSQYIQKVVGDKRHNVNNINGIVLYAEAKRSNKLIEKMQAASEKPWMIYQKPIDLNRPFDKIKSDILEIVNACI